MSNSKWMLSLIALGLFAGRGTAESQRPLFTVENAFPRWEQVELGVRVQNIDVEGAFGDSSVAFAGPYVRYGLMEDLAMSIDVPFASTDPAFGKSESGLSDIGVGFQLRAYEDIFGYPYFIPHVHVSLPTGDDEKGLGAGDPVYTFGLSYGDKVYDFLSWVLDLGYRVNPNSDNQLLLSTSILWHVSPQLTFIGEVRYEDNSEDSDDSLVLVAGGMAYNWTDALRMGLHFGGSITGDVNSISEFRLSYSF